jgi:hypothetical protein
MDTAAGRAPAELLLCIEFVSFDSRDRASRGIARSAQV